MNAQDMGQREGGFALTPVQAGMVFETLAQSDAAVNLEQVVLHLEDEAVDAGRMQAVWDRAIARHPALRLSFRQVAGHILQYVDPVFAAPLVVEDWTKVADPEQALAARLRQDRARGVDLSCASDWRLLWLRLGPRRSVLVWTFSHVALDGRSFRTVLEEVFADYDGLGDGGRRSVPTFRAHAEGVAQADKAAGKAFFAGYLAGFDRATPIGFAVPAPLDDGGHTVLATALTLAQTATLHTRAARAGVSFATMVQAAWGLVLARISGRAEVVFGVTRSGRYLTPGGQDMVGCLITTQPLRMAVTPETTLDGMLGQLRADLHAQRSHEGLALADIAAVSELGAGATLFNSLVMVERQSLNAALQAQGGAWATRRVELFEQGAVPLTLAAYGDECLQLRLEYMPERIAGADAARYLDYLATLLGAMSEAAPDAMLADLTMMREEERAALLALAAPEIPLPDDRPACIATAFEAVAARQPDALAVVQVGGDDALDYAALDRRANQFAQYLAQHGIGQGAILGLCLPRGTEFVALMLAASKVGAAFLPMDPGYPAETLRHMASDSAAAMILVEARADWMAGLPVVVVTPDLAMDAPTAAPPRDGLSPDRAAYVIYTSGTTGKPKGVVVSQRAFMAHAMAAIAAFHLTPADRVLQFAALSFDVALEEIVPTLLAGATLILRDEAMITSPQGFVETVATQGITVLNLPTGFWQVMLAGLEAGALRLPETLRLMVVGGERMPPDAQARWQALAGMPPLVNGYGPTEAAITCASYTVQGGVAGPEVPVGRAFGHALLYLRAPDGSLAPKDAVGELWIGGDAVALGYLGQPEAAQTRFAANPFAAGRIYRSGDVGHWNAAGDLVIAGRADRQIKLRGYRIEPAEIEALLEKIAGVAQAHVGLVTTGGARLMAWLRPSDPQAVPEIEAVRAHLTRELPAPKRPELIFVTDWPQTPGGKTDVKRLPVPLRRDHPPVADAMDPQTARLAGIFGTVLGLEAPGAEDSFFDLGGHSLQLLTLIGHIEAAFSTRLTVAQVHAQPTPRGLSQLLAGPVKISAGAELCDCVMPIQPLGSGIPIYGVHVLGVNGSFFRPLAQVMGLDQPIFGLTVGLLSADTPLTVPDTAALYFRAIQAHRPTGPVGLVAVSLGSYMALELAQQLRAAGRDVRLLALMDASGPAGRSKIKGMAWAGAHLALLRARGVGYARGLFTAKVDGLRHRLERLRLSASRRFSANGAVLKSVGGFVAANEVAIQNYTPRPYAGRLTIVRARDSVFDSDAAIASGLGWAEVAQGGFDVVDVQGDHLSILEEPGVRDVAQAFVQAMARD